MDEFQIKDIIERYLRGFPVEERKSLKHLDNIIQLVKANNLLVDDERIIEIYKTLIFN